MNGRSIVGVTAVIAAGLGGCLNGPPPPAKMSSSMASSDQSASCPGGTSVVGGGYEIAPEARKAGKVPIIVASRPTEKGWLVQCVDAEGAPTLGCKAYVLCATILN